MRSLPSSTLLKASLLAPLALAGALAQAGTLTVYTSLEEDEIKDYLAQAKQDLPDIQVDVLRLSTGDLGARILAEAGNPRHDVIWGWAVTNMMDTRILALLEAYQPAGSEALPARYRDPDGKWTAATGYMAAFCVNTAVLDAKQLPMPQTWADLLKPEYQGEIVMPNPVSSGTGYLQIAALLQKLGDEQGWQYLKSLDKNIAQYIKSGSRPCRAAQAGEYAIGTSLAFAAMKAMESGAPVKMVIPSDGAGYELEASALMRSARNPADARRFLDWTLSANAAAQYVKYKEIVTIDGVPQSDAARRAGMPSDLSSVLYPVDFVKSAQARDAILKTWAADIQR